MMQRIARKVRNLSIASGLGLFLLAAHANALFIVNQPWLKPARSGQSTQVYMNLTSTDGATLVSARSDDANGIVMRGSGKNARDIAALPLPAKTLVALAPGKEHLALLQLRRTVKLGQSVALVLTIEGPDGVRQDIAVSAEARMRSPVDDERRGHHHDH
jgi:periplasmic copper chaperone A